MIIACPHCSHRYKVADEAAGRQVRCTNCQNAFVVQAQAASPAKAALPAALSGPSLIETEETRLGSFFKPAYALVLTANEDLAAYPIDIQIHWMRQALVAWLAKRGPKAGVLDFWWMHDDANLARQFVQAAQQLICENFENADLLSQMSIEVKYMDHVRQEVVEQELERG